MIDVRAINGMREAFKAAYLDWVNNFATVARFAEYHGISEDAAIDVIHYGRVYHNEDATS